MELILFPEDTNIFMSDKCLDSLINKINIEITYISKWFEINKLSIIVKKQNFMLFCNKWIRKIKLSFKKYIGNISVEQVAETKFVGVIINENLTWGNHVLFAIRLAKVSE